MNLKVSHDLGSRIYHPPLLSCHLPMTLNIMSQYNPPPPYTGAYYNSNTVPNNSHPLPPASMPPGLPQSFYPALPPPGSHLQGQIHGLQQPPHANTYAYSNNLRASNPISPPVASPGTPFTGYGPVATTPFTPSPYIPAAGTSHQPPRMSHLQDPSSQVMRIQADGSSFHGTTSQGMSAPSQVPGPISLPSPAKYEEQNRNSLTAQENDLSSYTSTSSALATRAENPALGSKSYTNAEQHLTVANRKSTANDWKISRADGTCVKKPVAKISKLQSISPTRKRKRDEAKKALGELYQHKIAVSDILKEHVDPIILRDLSSEIGVGFPDQSLPQKTNLGNILPTNGPTSKADESLQPSSSRKEVVQDLCITESPNKPMLATPSNEKVNSEAQKRKITSTKPVPAISSIQASQMNQSPVVSQSITKPPITTPGNKLMERKDIIAQRLAAKAGRVVSKTSTPPFPTPATPKDQSLAIEPLSISTSLGLKNSAQKVPAHPVEPKSSAPSIQPSNNSTAIVDSRNRLRENTEAEAKRKAQTDLARQKMEALKARESKMAAQPAPLTTETLPRPVAPSSCLSSPSAMSPPPQTSSLPGFVTPTAPKPLFSLPGLFANPVPSVFGTVGIASTRSLEEPTFRTLPSFPAQQQVPETVQTEEAATHRPDSSKLDAKDPIVDNGSEAMRVPPTGTERRKRQGAADFMGSPPTKMRKLLRPNEDASVIIEVSDDEDSSIANDSVSERDGLSPAYHASTNGMPRQKAIRDLPPLSNFPYKNPLASGSKIMTPPAVQTPARTPDVQGLKVKEKEISEMKRKIAEFEEKKKKAKESISRVQSPKSSRMSTVTPEPIARPLTSIEPPQPPEKVERPMQNVATSTAVTGESSHPLSATTEAHTTSVIATPFEKPKAPEIDIQPVEDSAETTEAAPTAPDVIFIEDQESRPITGAVAINKPIEALNTAMGNVITQQHNVPNDDLQEISQEAGPTLPSGVPATQETKSTGLREPAKNAEGGRPADDPSIVQRSASGYMIKGDSQKSEDRQYLMRRREIESGIPMLDAQLETLKEQMRALEETIRKGVESRELLFEELQYLPDDAEAEPDALETPENNDEQAESAADELMQGPYITIELGRYTSPLTRLFDRS